MILALLLAILPAACHLIHSDWLLGRDLAATVPQLSTLAPEIRIGLAPVPSTKRIFGAPELRRIAAANHLATNIEESVCFAWQLSVPDRGAMLSAMRKQLDGHNPQIEIVESSLMPAPQGEMIFPLTGLLYGSEAASIWRGYVQYSGTKKFPVWARAVVKVKEKHLVASRDLHEGETLTPDQVRMEPYEGPIRRDKYVTDAGALQGMLTRRPIPAGTALVEDMIEAPLDVTRGDTVAAIIQTGGARLEVQAVAETNGRKGQIIPVRNPRSGRTFRARVEEKGVVQVVPGGQFGLVVEGKKS